MHNGNIYGKLMGKNNINYSIFGNILEKINNILD